MASTLLLLILGLLLSATNQITKSWRYTTGKIEAFQEARRAFESMNRRLSQATLNAYWDYSPAQTGTNPPPPTAYIRQSELRFATGRTESLLGSTTPRRPFHAAFFNANLGFVDNKQAEELNQLLNTWGYFIEFNNDTSLRPPFLTSPAKWRFRLMEFMEPSERLSLYAKTSGDPGFVGNQWFSDAFSAGTPPARVLADNIVALIILPRLTTQEDPTGTALAPGYTYRSDDPSSTNSAWTSNPLINSKHQVPPIVQITMVAIDQVSALRLQDEFGSSMPDLGQDTLFQNASNFESDLYAEAGGTSSLEGRLQELKLNYRIFTSNVAIPSARWSSEQSQ